MMPPAVVVSASATFTSTRSPRGAICEKPREEGNEVCQEEDREENQNALRRKKILSLAYTLSLSLARPQYAFPPPPPDALAARKTENDKAPSWAVCDDDVWSMSVHGRTFLYWEGISKADPAARTATLRREVVRRPAEAAAA